MASGQQPADPPPAAPYLATQDEHWRPAVSAIVIAALLHVALPAQYRITPRGPPRPCCWTQPSRPPQSGRLPCRRTNAPAP